ncbi:MAG: ABC transporter substrate-binding protein, partial [Clostridiales bacterium]|nr:ABC transporter substrate-binding protein [Clostridiales bacterium]
IDNLRDDALLQPLNISDFGGKNAIIAQLRDDPHWFDADNRRYWALPLACELPLLYYDSTRVQDPDWGFLFRLAYSGSIYLPASPSTLIPLFLHYYNLPYDYVEDNRLQEVLKHLSGQSGLTPAYLDQHMLDIPEWAGAALGVISSRDLPELKRRQEENPAYANWRAILPPSGAPMKVYYAALNKNGNSKAAAGFLAALTQPATMAAHTRIGGYLPTMREAQRLLSSTFPISFGERCRPLHINQQNQMLYEQIYRNVLLYEAQQTSQPIIDSLEFTFTRDGRVYRSCMIDLAHMQATVTWPSEQESGSGLQQQITVKLRYDQAKACAKELTRLGVALWKEYYDGASDNASWELRMIFANGDERICQGFGSPPLWLDLATALLSYSGVDLLPTML